MDYCAENLGIRVSDDNQKCWVIEKKTTNGAAVAMLSPYRPFGNTLLAFGAGLMLHLTP